MVTIRCTRKLLRHLRADAARPDGRPPTTRLGDWYSNLLFTKHQRLVICISERSLLPVIVAAKDPSSFSSRLQEAVRSMLWTIGVSRGALNDEMREMADVSIGGTASRSVVGSLNELALQAHYALGQQRQVDLLTLAMEVAETPCSALQYATPRRARWRTCVRRGETICQVSGTCRSVGGSFLSQGT
jgi:hypothetical protein